MLMGRPIRLKLPRSTGSAELWRVEGSEIPRLRHIFTGKCSFFLSHQSGMVLLSLGLLNIGI